MTDGTAFMVRLCDPATDEGERLSLLASIQTVTGPMLAACASFLLERAVRLDCPGAIDVCGSGGSGAAKTFNVSTAAAFVLAAGGVRIAKNGNRAVTSQSGSGDALHALGVTACATAADAEESFNRHGLCFLSAPAFHPALGVLAPARKALGRPTFMNALGPLCNPARPSAQVIGLFDENFLKPVAEAAALLGRTRLLALRGTDGLDEISPFAATRIISLDHGAITEFTLPAPQSGEGNLTCSTPHESAAMIEAALGNTHPAASLLVARNAGAGFVVAGMDADIAAGTRRALDVIASGAARAKLEEMRT
jgi:anthranilate phosphoribosyltransferase